MDNQQERFFEIGWLAGVWESEGWFSIRKLNRSRYNKWKYRPEIGFGVTDFLMLSLVQSILRKLQLPFYRTPDIKHSSKKKLGRISITGPKRCIKFLNVFLPYLQGEKKRRAEIVLRFSTRRLSSPRGIYTEQDDEDFLLLKVLNAPLKAQKRILNEHTLNTKVVKMCSELTRDSKSQVEIS